MDMMQTIAPKSDQMNADDLLGGHTITIKVTTVSLLAGDQPVAIHYDGDNGKPYKPCKSMRRVLVSVWGNQSQAYVGRSMTLYCDPKVTWGGAAVGGIRISHMSDMKEPMTMALTATKATRKPYTVNPLKTVAGTPATSPELVNAGLLSAQAGIETYTDWKSKLTAIDKKSIMAHNKKDYDEWELLVKKTDNEGEK